MKNLNQLIADYLDDALSEPEQTELNAWLKADPANVERFTEAVMFDQQIRTAAQARAQQLAATGFEAHVLPKAANSRRFFSRPVTAVAAGIVFGMFCTSMVFAFAVPRMRLERQRVIPLFSESFEDVKAVFGRGFPNDAGGWSGDFAAVVAAEGPASPKEGQHMARLAPALGRKFSTAARIIDLTEFPLNSDTESRTVEVVASFHGMETNRADRNQIRFAALAETPENVKAMWIGDSRLEQVLQHLGRTVTVKPGERGWQTLKASMEIPAGARSLVIHLGAGIADDTAPKTEHYIDDVHAQLVIREVIP
jgi:hypothetical protein